MLVLPTSFDASFHEARRRLLACVQNAPSLTPPVGFEPTTFELEVQRAIRCATAARKDATSCTLACEEREE